MLTSLKFLVGNVEKALLVCDTPDSYPTLTAGSRPAQMTAGPQIVLSQNTTAEKGKNHIFVATKAQIRVINPGQGLPTVRLLWVATTIGSSGAVSVMTHGQGRFQPCAGKVRAFGFGGLLRSLLVTSTGFFVPLTEQIGYLYS